MAFCSKCGAELASGAAFCGSCGQPAGTPGSGDSAGASPTAAAEAQAGEETGIEENIAGLLCYALGWVTGLIFFLIDRRPFVRFHAAQSIVVFGAVQVLFIFGRMFVARLFAGGLATLLGLLASALWIVLMVKAYQGERFKVPVASGIAEGFASK